MTGKISAKGQITVPIAIRRALGLRPGTRVAFTLSSGGATLRKHVPARHPGDAWIGAVTLPAGTTVDQLLEELRGPAPVRKRQAAAR